MKLRLVKWERKPNRWRSGPDRENRVGGSGLGEACLLLRWLAVPRIGAAPAPVRLRGDLIRRKAPAAKNLPQPEYHRGLAKQVHVPGTAGQLDFGRFAGEQCRLACFPPEPVQPADARPSPCVNFLLIVGLRYLDDQRRIGISRKRFR